MAAAAPLGPPVVVESGLAAEMIAPTGSSSAGSIAGGRIALGTRGCQQAPFGCEFGFSRGFGRGLAGGLAGIFPEVMRALRSAWRHP